jgi:hypothetical protein
MLLEHRLHVGEPTAGPGNLTAHPKRQGQGVTHPHRTLRVAFRQERVVGPLPGRIRLLIAPDQERSQAPTFEVSSCEFLGRVGIRVRHSGCRPSARVVRSAGVLAS